MNRIALGIGGLLLAGAIALGLLAFRAHGSEGARGADASPPGGVRLRIVTFNVWGLPFDRAPALDERLARIPAALRALDPDVICVQEAWTPKVARALVDGLAPQYHAAPVAGGGLMLFSRLSLSDASFTAHPEAPGLTWIEKLAHKGVLAATVSTAAGPLRVLDTHCTAFDHPSRDVQIRALVEKLLPAQPDLPIVFAGDFNLESLERRRHEGPVEVDPAYASILALGFTDSRPPVKGAGGLPSVPLPVTMSDWPRDADDTTAKIDGWSPDHVFVRGNKDRDVRVLTSSVELWTRATALSDHNLVLAEIEITTKK